MNNPFKFGSIVDGDFFTDRREELLQIERMLNSEYEANDGQTPVM